MKIYEVVDSIHKTLPDFVKFACDYLDIPDHPRIDIVDSVPGAEGVTFGAYKPEENTIYLVVQGRHPRDAMRTLAHELVHYKQDQEQRLKPESGETGSAEENEANAEAGVIMRNYNQTNPEDLQENFAGKRNGEPISQNDIIRIRGDINRLKQGTKAQRERGIRLQRQLQTYLNTHRPKNYAVGGTVDE